MRKLIYPDICRICGTFFENMDKRTDYILRDIFFEDIFCDILCAGCLGRYEEQSGFVCQGCGRKIYGEPGTVFLCEKCIKTTAFFSKIRSPFLFRDSIVDIVHMLKYNNMVFLAEKMSYFILKTYIDHFQEDPPDYVFPVPLHIKKLRKRGYNQTYLMAHETSKTADRFSICFPSVKKDVLIKVIDTKSQTGLDSEKRESNLKKAFKIKNPAFVRGKKILLIDDVMTTGATIRECARVLISGEAEKVEAITFARAM